MEVVKRREIKVEKCQTDEMKANILTKQGERIKFEALKDYIEL